MFCEEGLNLIGYFARKVSFLECEFSDLLFSEHV